MSDHDPSRRIDRRRFLQVAGTGLLAASVPAGSALAADADLPVRVKGTRVVRFVPDGDAFRKHEQFVSPELQPRYGTKTVEYDPEPVDARTVPEERRDAGEPFTVRYADVAVLGTWDQHVAAEKRLRGDDSGGVSATDQPSYFGPLYAYETASLVERTAPINVAWRRYLDLDAGDVKSTMLDNGWGSIIPSSDRYALLYDGNSWYAQVQEKHIRKPTGITDQWHCRAWTLPSAEDDDYCVAVQAHHDPWDHGHLGGDVDWMFAESRETVLDTWDGIGYYLTANQGVGNGGDFPSSNGTLGIVW